MKYFILIVCGISICHAFLCTPCYATQLSPGPITFFFNCEDDFDFEAISYPYRDQKTIVKFEDKEIALPLNRQSGTFKNNYVEFKLLGKNDAMITINDREYTKCHNQKDKVKWVVLKNNGITFRAETLDGRLFVDMEGESIVAIGYDKNHELYPRKDWKPESINKTDSNKILNFRHPNSSLKLTMEISIKPCVDYQTPLGSSVKITIYNRATSKYETLNACGYYINDNL